MLLSCDDDAMVLGPLLLPRRHLDGHEDGALVGDTQSPAVFNREAPALALYVDKCELHRASL